jgi:peroxiredoxin
VKLLIYFNTHCDFCQFEIEELSKRLPEFENTEIILVSAEPIDSIRPFMQTLGFHSYPGAGAYHCSYDTLNKYFGQLAAPTTFVYGTNNKLVKRFNGATRIDDLLQVVQTAQVNK